MIYITGDCHGNFERFEPYIFPEQAEMTKDDYVIICGDFGGVWELDTDGEQWREQFAGNKHNARVKCENMQLDWLESRSFTTLFVDGNHENYDRLNAYPVEERHGGRVHKIRPSVIHLMRGEVFDLCGRTFFAFGGASSHDIRGGILEPAVSDYKEKLIEAYKSTAPFRINHVSWWKEELASDEEKINGFKNLEKHDYNVDFIVSHCCSTSTQNILGSGLYKPDHETDYLDEVRAKTEFKKWFFGHYHANRNVNDKEICIYEQIIRVC